VFFRRIFRFTGFRLPLASLGLILSSWASLRSLWRLANFLVASANFSTTYRNKILCYSIIEDSRRNEVHARIFRINIFFVGGRVKISLDSVVHLRVQPPDPSTLYTTEFDTKCNHFKISKIWSLSHPPPLLYTGLVHYLQLTKHIRVRVRVYIIIIVYSLLNETFDQKYKHNLLGNCSFFLDF